LLAWLTLPAKPPQARASLAKTGALPPGYRHYALAPATRNFRIAALSAFYDWLLTEYTPADGRAVGITENPFKRVERPLSPFQKGQRPDGLLPSKERREHEPSQLFRRQQDRAGPIALTVAELQSVFEAIPFVSHGRNAANRNGALVRLLLWGMLREAEAVGTAWEAVDDETLWVYGKGRKYRAVPITDPSTWSYLHAYTNELHIPLEQRFHGAFFRQLDHEDRPITKHTIEHLLLSLRTHFRVTADTARRQGDALTAQALENLMRKLHSHIFRATGATLMAAAGMSLITLSMLLGHADPSTTQRYYLAADQLVLPETVRKICAEISGALEKEPSHKPGHAPIDPLQWYRRRGLLPQGNG
jgi:integrase